MSDDRHPVGVSFGDTPLDYLEQRNTVTVTSGPLLFVRPEIQAAYVDDLIAQAVAAMKATKGFDKALVHITIEVKPYAVPLGAGWPEKKIEP